jgi:hypothetical protein
MAKHNFKNAKTFFLQAAVATDGGSEPPIPRGLSAAVLV